MLMKDNVTVVAEVCILFPAILCNPALSHPRVQQTHAVDF